MPELHLTRGLPGSGKSTFARGWVAEDPDHRVRVNRDDIRTLVHGSRRGDSTEAATSTVSHGAIRNFLRRGWDVICDDTNLNNRTLRTLINIAEQTGAAVVYHDFPMSVEDAIAADAQRAARVGPAVIERFANRYLGADGQLPEPPRAAPPRQFKPYERVLGAPPAFIVDIDGTLAHNYGHRSFYDYSDRVLQDGVHQPVLLLTQLLIRNGLTPIVMSGRDDVCRDLTMQWLFERCDLEEADYLGPFMRITGDKRDDAIVKLELFDANVRDHFDVQYVLDDRNRVVEAWRSIGLTVLQVADGDF